MTEVQAQNEEQNKKLKLVQPTSAILFHNKFNLAESITIIENYYNDRDVKSLSKFHRRTTQYIKTLLLHKEAIFGRYKQHLEKTLCLTASDLVIYRQKVNFLGECLYEYLQRASFHLNLKITEITVLATAFQLRRAIGIDHFLPDKDWLKVFCMKYNISFEHEHIPIRGKPKASLQLPDIMLFCSRYSPVAVVPPPEAKRLAAIADKKRAPKRALPPRTETAEPDAATNGISPKKIRARKSATLMALEAATAAGEHLITQEIEREIESQQERKIKFLQKAIYEYLGRYQYHNKMPIPFTTLYAIANELKEVLRIENFEADVRFLQEILLRFNVANNLQITKTRKAYHLSLDIKDILSYCSRFCNDYMPPAKEISDNNNIEYCKKDFELAETAGTSETAGESGDDDDVIAVETKCELIEIKDDDDEETVGESIKGNEISCHNNQVSEGTNKIEHFQTTALKISIVPDTAYTASVIQNTTKNQSNAQLGNNNNNNNNPMATKLIRNKEEALQHLKPLEEFAFFLENDRLINAVSQLECLLKKLHHNAKMHLT